MRGFTLVETIIYLGLLSILLTGAVEALSSIEADAQSSNARAAADREGNFILAKIDWALAESKEIEAPRAGEGSALVLSTGDPSLDPIVVAFDATRHTITLAYAGGAALPLASEGLPVDAASFTPLTDAGGVSGVEATVIIRGIPFTARRFVNE